MANSAQRDHLARLMDYLALHTGQVHYRMFRPMDVTDWSEQHMRAIIDNGGGIWMDCSEGVTGLCKWAGFEDPNGSRYSGYGNTDTLYAHLPHYHDARRALVGALVVFGDYPNTHHVAMVRKPDPKHGNPTLWSHGQESDPRLISLADEWRSQRGRPYTFLSIAKL